MVLYLQFYCCHIFEVKVLSCFTHGPPTPRGSLRYLASVEDIWSHAYESCRKLKESECAMKENERLMVTLATVKGYDTVVNMRTQLASSERACGDYLWLLQSLH